MARNVNQGPTLADVRRLVGEQLGVDGAFYQRLVPSYGAAGRAPQDTVAETVAAASTTHTSCMPHHDNVPAQGAPTPLTPRTLALHQEAWAARIAAAQVLKKEALVLQAEAVAKLQEACSLLAAASVTPIMNQTRPSSADALARACEERKQQVREEMPPANGIAAFARLCWPARDTDAPASLIATQSLVSGDGTWVDDYELVDKASRSWATLP